MITTVAASTAAVLLLLRLVLFTSLHLVPSDYSPVRHAVSDYAVGRTRRLSTAMTWATALAWLALAVAAGRVLVAERTSVTAELVALAALFAVLPFLPTDTEGARRSVIGRLHLVAAIAWFALSYNLTGTLDRLLAPGPLLGRALTGLHWVALVSLVALVVSLLVPALRRRTFGLSERVFIVAINLFFLGTAIALLG